MDGQVALYNNKRRLNEITTAPPRKHVREACSECKSRHRKCDGGFPCEHCQKRNLDCTYGEERQKRGPKPASFYLSVIAQLKEELEFYKKQLQDQQINSSMIIANTSFTEDQLFFQGFTSIYKEAIGNCVEILQLPLDDVDDFDFSNPISQFKRYGVCAVGARLLGHLDVSIQCAQLATNIEKVLIDKTDENVAAGLSLLGYYNALVGELDAASRYLTTGKVILENLHHSKRPCCIEHFAGTLVGLAELPFDPHETLYLCKKARRLNCKSPNILFSSNMLEVHSLILMSQKENEPFDSGYNSQLLDQSEVLIESYSNHTVHHKTLSAIFFSIKGRYYHFLENKELALHYSSKSLSLTNEIEVSKMSITVLVLALTKLLYVFHGFNEMDKFLIISKKLNDLSERYPIATKLFRHVLTLTNISIESSILANYSEASDIQALLSSSDDVDLPIELVTHNDCC